MGVEGAGAEGKAVRGQGMSELNEGLGGKRWGGEKGGMGMGGARMRPSWAEGEAVGGSNKGGVEDPVKMNVNECSRHYMSGMTTYAGVQCMSTAHQSRQL